MMNKDKFSSTKALGPIYQYIVLQIVIGLVIVIGLPFIRKSGVPVPLLDENAAGLTLMILGLLTFSYLRRYERVLASRDEQKPKDQ